MKSSSLRVAVQFVSAAAPASCLEDVLSKSVLKRFVFMSDFTCPFRYAKHLPATPVLNARAARKKAGGQVVQLGRRVPRLLA